MIRSGPSGMEWLRTLPRDRWHHTQALVSTADDMIPSSLIVRLVYSQQPKHNKPPLGI